MAPLFVFHSGVARKPSRLKVALTAGRLASRRLLRRRESSRDAELGELLTEQLDDMKGLAMKLGQIVSYMDVPIPASAQAKLAQLQRGVRGMPEARARAVLESALGAEVTSQFEDFDWVPVAAASIGQVHRATLEGRDVAVKLQYPHVDEGFESDLGSVERIASLASMASAVDGKAIVRELRARLAEECDYEREGAYQAAFAAAFEDDPAVHVPHVVPRFTTRSTLVTTWSSGLPLEEAAGKEPASRNAYARTLVRFGYRSLLVLAALQADPHPGNYLFGPGERVTFLDFGCVRTFASDYVEMLRALVRAIDRRDMRLFREMIIGLEYAPRPERFDFDHHFAMMEHLHRPLLAPRFEFQPKYVQRGYAYNGPTNPNARHMNMPAPAIWIARMQWGLWSVLTRLGAHLTLRDTLDEIMGESVAPLRVEHP